MATPRGEGDTLTIQASEFQRLQGQLIELRTTNYQLKEEQQRLASENDQLNDELQTKGRELDKANKVLQRSKKAREMSFLLEENDSLQQKLHSQEQDFNLQNRTLMEEISRVCEENERLKTQQKKAGGGGEGDESLTRLRAENKALKKSLHVLREKLSDSVSETSVKEMDGEGSRSEGTQPAGLELQLQLDTEREEKALLLTQLEEVQESAKKEQAQLQSQLDMWVDKAKKKQDSFVKLQEEKEKLFMESRAAFDKMVRAKEHDLQSLQEQVQKLTQDLQTKDEMSSVGAEIAHQLQSLSTEKGELNLKCASLIQEREELKALAEELGRELHQSKAQVGELRTETDYLNTQLEEARLSQEQLADQVAKASEDRQTLEKKLESAEKLAGKRKTLVDEMSIRGQETAEEQKKKMEEIQEKLRKEVVKLERELDEERGEARRLGVANDEIPELQKRVGSLEEEQERHTATVNQMETTIREQRENYESELQRLTAEHEAERESLQRELAEVGGEVEEGRERVRELEVTLQDKEEMVRIVEKKSNGLLKDLKRQLAHMQKREEKRQEQLAEFTRGPGGDGYGIVHEQSSDNLSKHSRESSLSSIRGHLPATEGSISSPSSSYATTPAGASSMALQVGCVGEEMRELLGRVTDLQREKWELEERVNHLETTGSSLAEDVVNKSEIIKSFYMHNKADHTPPRRKMADKMSPMRLLGATNKEDTLNEINRKMQRVLEETLTKNIHLQENVLMLSTELQKYTDREKLLQSSAADNSDPPTTNPSPCDSTSQSSTDHMTVT